MPFRLNKEPPGIVWICCCPSLVNTAWKQMSLLRGGRTVGPVERFCPTEVMFRGGRVTEHIIECSAWPSVSYCVEVVCSAGRPHLDHFHPTLPVVLETVLRGSLLFVGETSLSVNIMEAEKAFRLCRAEVRQLSSCRIHENWHRRTPSSSLSPCSKCSHHSLKAYLTSRVEMKAWSFEYSQDPLMPNHEVCLRAFSIPDSERCVFSFSPPFFLRLGEQEVLTVNGFPELKACRSTVELKCEVCLISACLLLQIG